MRVDLAYGIGGLTVDFPDDRTTVVTPVARPAAADEAAELRRALRKPVARAAAARPRAARADGGDLRLRLHPAATPAPDDPRPSWPSSTGWSTWTTS